MMLKEYETKEIRIMDFLQSNHLDGILLSRRDSFAWVTCGGDNSVFKYTEQGVADILITKENKYIILSEVEKYRILDEEISGQGFKVVGYDWYGGREPAIKKSITGKKIVSDTGAYGLQNVFKSFRILRYSLLPQEILRFRALCEATSKAVGEVCYELKKGNSEYEIAANLTERLLRQGIKVPVCLIAVDERIKKYRHPIPGNKKAEKYVLVSVGSEKYGLFASLSRMVSFGEPSDEIIKKNEACMRIDAEMISNTAVGVKVSDILNCGVAAYAANGYPDEWKMHHQGGSTGYHAREYLATFDIKDKVMNNQAFSWNPTIAGVKCEDTYLIKESGQEILTTIEKWPVKDIKASNGIIKKPDILIK